MNTEGLLMALERFWKRRGMPSEILTDNGTNFVAVEREIREALAAVDTAKVTRELASHRIKWRFNPPAAPHFGGVFETMVKAMKRTLPQGPLPCRPQRRGATHRSGAS